jgi:hypothetical protein
MQKALSLILIAQKPPSHHNKAELCDVEYKIIPNDLTSL